MQKDMPALDEAASRWGMVAQFAISVGRVYFYAPRKAMERGDFSGAWAINEN